jgi:hypothetical protein
VNYQLFLHTHGIRHSESSEKRSQKLGTRANFGHLQLCCKSFATVAPLQIVSIKEETHSSHGFTERADVGPTENRHLIMK